VGAWHRDQPAEERQGQEGECRKEMWTHSLGSGRWGSNGDPGSVHIVYSDTIVDQQVSTTLGFAVYKSFCDFKSAVNGSFLCG
jgi:hypothetical protein